MFDVKEDSALKKVGLELMFLTPEKCSRPDGISAVELAKSLNLSTETVRKKLKILQEKEIVTAKGINPKLWVFNEYSFQKMDEEDELYQLLCCFDDVDFSRFFEY